MYLDNLFDRCIDSGFVLISSKLLDKELYPFCSSFTGSTSEYWCTVVLLEARFCLNPIVIPMCACMYTKMDFVLI